MKPKSEIKVLPKTGPQSSPGLGSLRTRDCVVGVLIIVDRKHWKQYVQMRGVFDVPAGWIPCRFDQRLADRRLHLLRIRLRQDPVEIQIEGRPINAVDVLQVG
jgi:hypothetical protein